MCPLARQGSVGEEKDSRGEGQGTKRTGRRKCEGQRPDTVWKAMIGGKSNPDVAARRQKRGMGKGGEEREMDMEKNNGAQKEDEKRGRQR